MTNAKKFESTFGLFAAELWAMPEKDFLAWLNAEYNENSERKACKDCQEFDCYGCEYF